MSKAGPALRSEVDGVWYLDAHPEVAECFRQTGVFAYCEKLTTFHQQVAETFSLSYDGRIAKIGREEIIIDEAAIAEYTGLSRTGDCWFKTTIPANTEFRSYLLPVHKDLTWKKDIPMSYLEPKWQSLLKAILVYITCEGRYNRVMYYHFKLLNHFTGRGLINLPYFFHKTLTKMARQVKAQPAKVSSRLSHQGLITLLVREALQRKQIEWGFFLFWNEFQTERPPEAETKKARGRKAPTPKSSHRKRKGISIPRDPIKASPSKKEGIKRKLQFEDKQSKNPATGKNLLNLPYSDSESEQGVAETQDNLQIKQDADFHSNLPSSSPPETHRQPEAEASSSRPKKGRTQKINKLLQQIYEMEVLERVIKKANTDLTDRNAELFKMNQTLKEKHDKIKDRNRVLIRENMKLYRQLRILRLKLKEFKSPEEEQTGLDTLANLATTIMDTPELPTQPAEVRRSARTRAATSKKS
jgi:hypothetical protein